MIETSFDADRRLTTHTALGAVVLDEVLRAFPRWFDHPEFDPDVPVLWDFTNGQPHIGLDELIALNASAEGERLTYYVNAHRNRGRTAWVVTTGFGRAIIETVLAERTFSAEWKVFMDRAEALEWLGVTPD